MGGNYDVKRDLMMRNLLFLLFFLLICMIRIPVYAEDKNTKPASPQISGEDMEIVKVLEILSLMDLMEDLDLLKDMDLLIEEENHENND